MLLVRLRREPLVLQGVGAALPPRRRRRARLAPAAPAAPHAAAAAAAAAAASAHRRRGQSGDVLRLDAEVAQLAAQLVARGVVLGPLGRDLYGAHTVSIR